MGQQQTHAPQHENRAVKLKERREAVSPNKCALIRRKAAMQRNSAFNPPTGCPKRSCELLSMCAPRCWKAKRLRR